MPYKFLMHDIIPFESFNSSVSRNSHIMEAAKNTSNRSSESNKQSQIFITCMISKSIEKKFVNHETTYILEWNPTYSRWLYNWGSRKVINHLYISTLCCNLRENASLNTLSFISSLTIISSSDSSYFNY